MHISIDYDLERKLLRDLTLRSRAGIFIYLCVWFFTTVWVEAYLKTPIFFYINTFIFITLSILRIVQHKLIINEQFYNAGFMYKCLVLLILICALHWGIVSAWFIHSNNYPELNYIYIAIITGFSIGGSSTLSISKEIRVFYPIFILCPAIIYNLVLNDDEHLASIIMALFLFVYLNETSKITSKDYWETVTGYKLSKEKAQFLEQLSITDQLTQLKNRLYFENKFSEEWKRSSRTKSSLSVLILDLDHFKSLNDKYGHLFGDNCLREISNVMKQEVPRETDTLARYGGEEFIILLPDTKIDEATRIASRLLKVISETKLHANGETISITCSIGVSSIIPTQLLKKDQFLISADDALYKAKKKGRNQFQIGDA